MKEEIIYFWLDILDFFGNIEMKIKHFIHKKYYNSLSEKDIPKKTFYCYSGCRCFGDMCPYMDFSIIADSKYCHYVKGGLNEPLLWDDCKICGISEYEECE